jgi:two-component sensor histidine kinase
MVSEGLLSPDRPVEIKVVGSTGPVGAEIATPLAVTVTELLQNALEHAFPGVDGGTIGVELDRSPEQLRVVVWDDGIGMPADAEKGARLGLQIVRSLVQEMGGAFEITSEAGTRVELRIPLTGT